MKKQSACQKNTEMSHASSPRSGMLNHKLGEVSSLLWTLGNSNIAITIRHCNIESALVWKDSKWGILPLTELDGSLSWLQGKTSGCLEQGVKRFNLKSPTTGLPLMLHFLNWGLMSGSPNHPPPTELRVQGLASYWGHGGTAKSLGG